MVRTRIHTSLISLGQLRSGWEFIRQQGQGTTFQDFDWNLLAARMFSDREEPFVVVAEASYGVAIVPAVLRHESGSLRLLGEELFDYRSFLHAGDETVLRSALRVLAEPGRPFEVLALRECDRNVVFNDLTLEPFTVAPAVARADISATEFGSRHPRLARNLRRFQRRGFEVRVHNGENSSLIRTIYQAKAQHDAISLFHDPVRVEFMVEAARLQPASFEVFTLESGGALAAVLVTFREEGVRRFYTCLFDDRFARLSPAMVLIHEVTRQSLDCGLDCDYMTGEQGYKLRLATRSMPLFRVRASSGQLAALKGTAALPWAG